MLEDLVINDLIQNLCCLCEPKNLYRDNIRKKTVRCILYCFWFCVAEEGFDTNCVYGSKLLVDFDLKQRVY